VKGGNLRFGVGLQDNEKFAVLELKELPGGTC